jgi:uncharacterized protein (DUF58 family)
MAAHFRSITTVVSNALSRDIWPGGERWLRRLRHPAACLTVALVAAGLCAWFAKPVAVVACAALLTLLLLGSAWPGISLRGLSARLDFRQPRVTEGQSVRVELTVTNRWPWPAWGVFAEADLGTVERAALPRIPGWSTSTFTWECTPRCRGCHPGSPPRLVTGFPFGLRTAARPVTVDRPLLVWPLTVSLDTLLDAAATRPADDLVASSRAGESGDASGTRPFRPGDSLRRVHWPLTARTGTMVVSERQAPVLSAVRVEFDSDPALHTGTGPDGSLEEALRIVASIALAYQRANAHVELCHGHHTITVEPGEPGRRRLLDALARLRPAPTACTAAQGGCQRIHPRDCGVFHVTVVSQHALALRTEHRHVHGDRLWIVLGTGAPRTGLAGRCLRVEGIGGEAFRQAWKGLCHAG